MMTINYENPFSARWSRAGNTLCLGHWIITYNDALLNIPDKNNENHMDTYGIYSFMSPDDPLFAEGLHCDEWIIKHADWVVDCFIDHAIPADEIHLRWFYEAINLADWRCGSCGGC